MIGHMGILGTHMFYDKTTDTGITASFGSAEYAGGSVKTLIMILVLMYRSKP